MTIEFARASKLARRAGEGGRWRGDGDERRETKGSLESRSRRQQREARRKGGEKAQEEERLSRAERRIGEQRIGEQRARYS